MSNWGQGHINNTIGWGQGAVNNTNSFGIDYRQSFSGRTSLGGEVGLPLTNLLQARSDIFEAKACLVRTLTEINAIQLTASFLANSLEERVSLDAGTFEAKQCLIDNLNTI